MSRRRKSETRAPVEWRAGVHITGTPLWCDALRTREACFVSSAQIASARRHREIIATQATLDLLPEGAGHQSALTVPYGRPFTLGEARLELFPSGSMVGAAALLVDSGSTRIVYAGAVDTRMGRAEVRSCDVLVVDGTFAHPRFEFPPAADVQEQIIGWVDAVIAEGATPVLLVPPVPVGLELMGLLGGARPLAAHRSFVDAARRWRAFGVSLPPVARFGGATPAGTVVFWPPAARAATALAGISRARLAFISGWALDGATADRLRVDAAFPLAEQGGHAPLIDYILQTGATQIYLLGAEGSEMTSILTARGLAARRIGPPEQLSLL